MASRKRAGTTCGVGTPLWHRFAPAGRRKLRIKASAVAQSNPNRDSNVALCCVRYFLFNVRELAAVQTFPPDYEWPDAVKQAQRQIGNAVPPLVAQLLMGGE